MDKFTTLTGIAAPLLRANINTDLLAPIRRPDRPNDPPCTPKTFDTDIGSFLLAAWRYNSMGEVPDFVLNRPQFCKAGILLAGPNFGCGSSRETAVWALIHFGIRCVIAPSFGTIFYGNCFKNGLLPVSLPVETIEHLASKVEVHGRALPLNVSLVDQTITTSDGEVIAFSVSQFRRHALLEGLDPIQQTLTFKADIDSFTSADRQMRPWVYASP